MGHDGETTNRLRALLSQLISLTESGELHWERQLGSAHRYARWKDNLLILGPSDPPTETSTPRYLFVTPFDSPACVEINSADESLGPSLLKLVAAVEKATKDEPPSDPFALTHEVLNRLVK
jgi:hypothetical protein